MGHVKKLQKSSKSVKNIFLTLFDIFRAGQKSSKCGKNILDTFQQFRVAPVFRPLLGGSDFSGDLLLPRKLSFLKRFGHHMVHGVLQGAPPRGS